MDKSEKKRLNKNRIIMGKKMKKNKPQKLKMQSQDSNISSF